MSNEEAASGSPEEEGPDQDPFFGNEAVNLTPWLIEWVRVSLAEHQSSLYDSLPPHAIPSIVHLTLKGMDAANDASEPPQNPASGPIGGL